MMWLIAGILSPFLWAISNLIDQLAMRKYFKGQSVEYRTALVLPRLFLLPLMFFIPVIYEQSFWTIALLMSFGMGYYFAIIPYTKALEIEESSRLVPFMQTIPIFMFVMLYVTLGETITLFQSLGCLMIVLSAFCIMADYKTFKIKLLALVLMTLTAIGLAFMNTLQRIVLINDVPWYVLFIWMSFGKVIGTSFIYMFSAKQRLFLKKLISKNERQIWLLFITQQLTTNGAFIFFIISISLVPSGVITQSLNGLQSIFALLISYLFAKIFPDYFNPPKTKHEFIWYVVFFIMMLAGTVLIYKATA